jgi:succinate dehydrogenase / fumarate reductase cytochrome b subunit
MRRLLRLLRTSIGQKFLMALTGALLVVFLIVHVLGNLLVFKGQDAFDAYADYLKGHPLLWFFRIGLFLVFTIHIVFGVILFRENRQARTGRYAIEVTRRPNTAARTMLYTGLILLAFVIFHILHLTVGAFGPADFGAPDAEGRPNVYHLVLYAFGNPWIMAIYVAAMLFLGVHLIHGVGSTFQTLGFNHEIYNPVVRVFAWALAVLLVVGFCSIPLAIFLFPKLFPGGGSGS